MGSDGDATDASKRKRSRHGEAQNAPADDGADDGEASSTRGESTSLSSRAAGHANFTRQCRALTDAPAIGGMWKWLVVVVAVAVA